LNEPSQAPAGQSGAQAIPAGTAPVVDDEAHLIERLVTSEQVFHGKLLDVRRDTVALHGNLSATREYVVHPGAVMVVPILDDGRLVMERQFRYPLARVLLEFPAGKIDAGESTAQCAARELAEETGYRAGLWARACVIHNACAYSTEAIEIWFARELTLGERGLDDGELLDLVLLSEAELDSRAGSGEVTDVKTLIGLQWLQKWRAGTWALDWRALSAWGVAPIIAAS
jgi:ADP-ribose pyrophosphatase